jgi:hypothetical protein
MSVQERSHYVISSSDLAKWLETQGDQHWWSVDGDPLLTGLISFPCPSSELAAELKKLSRNLFLQDKDGKASGESISIEKLDQVADHDETQNRLFLFGWEGAPPEDLGWLLVEDRQTAESNNRTVHATRE